MRYPQLATRQAPSVEYDDTSMLAWNVIAPRFDVLLGVPALSRHLVFAAGVSYRPVAPLLVNQTDGKQLYRYDFPWGDSASGTNMWPRFIEFGFAFKYLL